MPNETILRRGTSVDPNNLPSTLTKNELSRQAKKEHLASKGVRGPEAEEILLQLYGPEEEPNVRPNPQTQDAPT